MAGSASFDDLLSLPSGDIEKPPLLPAGTYIGQITKGDKVESREKKTPGLRFFVKLLEPGRDFAPDAFADPKVSARVSKFEGHTDFWVTEDSLFRLRDFVCGVLGEKPGQRTIKEQLPDTINKTCSVVIEHIESQRKEIIAVVRELLPIPA